MARLQPTLMVLDYAGSCAVHLKTLVRRLASQLEWAEGAPPLRLLLLERYADLDSGWLGDLIDRGWDTDSSHLFSPVLNLAPFGTLEDRFQLLRLTVEAGARFHTGHLGKAPEPGAALNQTLSDPKWQDPLVLMMAALTAFTSGWADAFRLSRTDLAKRVASREEARIGRFAMSPGAADPLRHMAACATLTGGIPESRLVEEAEVELAALHWPYPGGAARLAWELVTALPAPQGCGGVEPDVVSEAFLLLVLRSRFQDGIGTLIRATRREPKAVDFIIRTLADFEEARRWLAEAGSEEITGLLYAIDRKLPEATLELRETAAMVSQTLLKWLRKV